MSEPYTKQELSLRRLHDFSRMPSGRETRIETAKAAALTGTSADRGLPPGLHVIDPLEYPRWDALVSAHPGSSFCHGTAWARVLQDSYGHVPLFVGRITDGGLEGALPIMEVTSPWTGRRGVSLPFIDCCSPMAADDAVREQLHAFALKTGRERGWKYLECRDCGGAWTGGPPSLGFHGHVLELVSDPKALYKKLDDSVRRGINKAEREGVRVDFSNSLESMRSFYALHCRTRRRHGLPVQPFRFFENIVRHVIEPGQGCIVLARHGSRIVAGAVFFHDRRQALYKYGASDYRFQQLRANNLVMWEAIRWCARRGFERLHFGRTSLAHEGLRRFKLGFGAREERIDYSRYDFARQSFVTSVDRVDGWFNTLFRWQPLPLLRLAGKILYPHLS